jgi:MFS superfamily sulfate permease-like transporter
MAERAGTRSQFGQLVFAAVVAVVLLCLSGYLRYLPHCVLAAIVFTIAIGLVNVQSLKDIRAESPGEFALALITAAAVVLAGVEHGILLAVALSLMRHVRHSYHPHTMVLTPVAPGKPWQFMPTKPGAMTTPQLIVYRFGADLFYANDHFFAAEVTKLVDTASDGLRHLVVDAGAITDLDYSAARTIGELIETLRARGVAVIFGRVNRFLRNDMDRHGLTPVLGASNVFDTLHEALAAAGVNSGAHVPDAL